MKRDYTYSYPAEVGYLRVVLKDHTKREFRNVVCQLDETCLNVYKFVKMYGEKTRITCDMIDFSVILSIWNRDGVLYASG